MFVQFCKQILLHSLNSNCDPLKNFKYYKQWRLSQFSNSIIDASPCITYEAKKILDIFLRKDMLVFEYGGGGSSLYFSDRAKQVFSVEHNKEWYDKINQILFNTNWKGFFIPPVFQINDSDPSDPDNYSTAEKNAFYHNYVCEIDNFKDSYFDLIMIDGRSRPSCIKHSIPKLKKGGLLVIDDIYRDYYLKKFEATLKKDFTNLCWKKGPVPYYSFFAQTGVWQKNNL